MKVSEESPETERKKSRTWGVRENQGHVRKFGEEKGHGYGGNLRKYIGLRTVFWEERSEIDGLEEAARAEGETKLEEMMKSPGGVKTRNGKAKTNHRRLVNIMVLTRG